MTRASKRQQIIEEFQARLQRIEVANDYDTNAGQAVFLGEQPELGESDPEVAIALLVEDDLPGYQGEHMVIQLPLQIVALAKADIASPYLTIETILSDIKRAIEQLDRSLGGLVLRQFTRGTTRTVERQPGSTTVGVAVRYVCPYRERWGDPSV